jgi:Mn2+/Fe2+ NRAMP family transporter
MKQIWSWHRRIGPAIILAAVVLGPGSITLSTIAGSRYSYRLLWVVVLATIFMTVFTLMSARIGLASERSLLGAVRLRFGPIFAQAAGLFGFLSILAFQAGNTAAVGFSLDALLGLNSKIGSLAMTLFAIAFLYTSGLYPKLETLVKIVVGFMLMTFLGTLALVGIDSVSAIKGLIPVFPDNPSIFLALGMSATTFSIAAAAYQSYLIQEKKWENENSGKEALVDSILGISVLGCLSMVILMTSAGVIAGTPEGEFSAQTMARQLEPVAGPAAFYLFNLGFFFASFSSLIVNPLIGAALLMDGFNKDPRIGSKGIKGTSAVILVCGMLVVALFGSSPIALLRAAQSMAIVAFPVLGFFILRLSADKKLMGSSRNGIWLNTLGILGYTMIIGIVLNYLRTLFS